MNKAIYVSQTLSPVNFPSIIGFVNTHCTFTPDIQRVGPKDLKASIKVTLFIVEDMTGSAKHEILSSISSYDMPVNEEVTEDDLFQIYKDAQQKLMAAFLHFQVRNHMQPVPLKLISKEELKKELSELVSWYYSALN